MSYELPATAEQHGNVWEQHCCVAHECRPGMCRSCPHPASSTQHPPQRKVVQEECLRVHECHGKCAAATAAAVAAAGGGGGPAGGIGSGGGRCFRSIEGGPLLPCTAIEWFDLAASSCQTRGSAHRIFTWRACGADNGSS